jgi:5-formyltetrahydrofolate cyclo-ligase
MQTKSEVRRIVRQRRTGVAPAEMARRSEEILRAVEALPEFRDAPVVAAYWSLADEVATRDFVRRWCERKTVLLPVMCPGGRLELKPYRPDCTMTEAAFRVAEPDGEAFEAGRVGLILVPGVAFDRRNNRLGRGKGYYDRLLSGIPAFRVGLCFDFQLFDEIPTDRHDVPMDRVVSG